MEPVLRALAIYAFLLLLIRLSGKRTLAQITTFDFVLLLIVGEATQQALLGDDFSVMNALIVLTTLIGTDIGLSLLQRQFPSLAGLFEGRPLLIFSNGSPVDNRMYKSRVDDSDILEAARQLHGLERLEQIKYAILERDGAITIVPQAEAEWRSGRTEES